MDPTLQVSLVIAAFAVPWLVAAVNNSEKRGKWIPQSAIGAFLLATAGAVFFWNGLSVATPRLFNAMVEVATSLWVWGALVLLTLIILFARNPSSRISFKSRVGRMLFVFSVAALAGLVAWAATRTDETSPVATTNTGPSQADLDAKDAQILGLRGQITSLEGQLREPAPEGLQNRNTDLERQVTDLERQVADWKRQAEEARQKLGSRSAQLPIPPTYDAVSAELWEFYRGYVEQTNNDLTPMLNISSGQDDLDTLLPTYLDLQLKNAYDKYVAALNHDRLEYGQFSELFQGFCAYIGAYREKRRWLFKLGDLSEKPERLTGHQNYSTWVKRNDLLEGELIKLAARAEFAGLRDCAGK